MDQCLLRLEFQAVMFCRNSILIKLISPYWFYMNFKGHERIQSGILKKIHTRWHEPMPKDSEEACCFCFALFCFVFQHSRRRHIPPKQELFLPHSEHSIHPNTHVIFQKNWIWKDHRTKECLTSQSNEFLFLWARVFCYPSNNSSSNNDVNKS